MSIMTSGRLRLDSRGWGRGADKLSALLHALQLTALRGLVVITLGALSGCSYLGNRGQDLSDVFTLAVETRGVHAGVGLLPAIAALGYADGAGYGLRNGTHGSYDYSEQSFGLFGHRVFTPRDSGPRGRKHCNYWWISPAVRNERDVSSGGVAETQQSCVVCFGNIEASLAVGVGVRAGVNLVELSDFLLGVAGLDILHDDALR